MGSFHTVPHFLHMHCHIFPMVGRRVQLRSKHTPCILAFSWCSLFSCTMPISTSPVATVMMDMMMHTNMYHAFTYIRLHTPPYHSTFTFTNVPFACNSLVLLCIYLFHTFFLISTGLRRCDLPFFWFCISNVSCSMPNCQLQYSTLHVTQKSGRHNKHWCK